MELRGIEFGNVFAASGTLNFFGDGWWYHRLYRLLFSGFKDLNNCTFISKTTTWDPRAGRMRLKENLQPKDLLPDCIKLYPIRGIILNAVSLSGPGAKKLFAIGKWQEINKIILISFMSVAETPEERLIESSNFKQLFKENLPLFKAPVGVELNVSCPNTDHDPRDLEKEVISTLKKFAELEIPISLKVNVFFDTDLLKKIAEEKLCDVITVSNTIPFGAAPLRIKWKKLFWLGRSPLKKYGGGGLSGKVILPLVLDKIKLLRLSGINIPIKGGGGIMHPDDVNKMKTAGASAIEFATVAMLRPWRVKKIIERANEIF